MAAAGKRYELLDRIGVGGMAEVFRARVKGDAQGPQVVVKRILPHLSENEDFRRMFMDEARIAAALQHPNIVRLVDLGRMDDSLFIALEYVDGLNLDQFLAALAAAKRKLPLDVAVFITVEILKGLDHAHTRLGPDGKPLGIVHRDVAPGNVLIARDGTVKVSDFGLARATVRASQTIAGVIKGNAKFMAPEQVYGSAMDARTDVYAAGMVLFTMLAGRNPFDDLPLPTVLDRVIKGAMPVPSAFNADVPPALDQIVEHATKISPRLRYASAAELRAALEAFAREMKLHLRAKSLADLLESLDETRRGVPAGAGAPSIVARLGPLIAESVASTGGSLITTLGKISNPQSAENPEDTHPETHARTGTLITRAPPGALTRGPGRLLGHRQAVSAVAVAPNGLVGISASHDQTVIVWDLVNRTELRRIRAHSAAVTALALAADGVTLVTGSRDKTLKVFDASNGSELAVLRGHTGWVFAVAISADDRFALSGSFDHTARLWDLRTRKPVATLEGHGDSVATVAFSADGRLAVTGSYDKTVRSWDLSTLREKRSIRTDDSVRAAAVSRDGSTALSAGADSVIRLWDLTWGTEINSFVGHREPVVALCFSPDGKRALSGSYDGTVRLWRIDAGECIATFEGPREPVLSVAFGPDGHFALSGGGDGAVSIWELP